MGMQNTSFELRANDRRNFVLQLPAGEFIKDSTKDVTNAFEKALRSMF